MRTMVGGCPAERTLKMVSGRWKLIVLNQLFQGTLRFSDLRRRINDGGTGGRALAVTPKMLTQELRQMEADGLIHREVFAQVPPKVEYSLTPLGRSLRPVVLALADWGRQHGEGLDEANGSCGSDAAITRSSYSIAGQFP
jgi:DNA-binding HxlR family transcriptional regulator